MEILVSMHGKGMGISSLMITLGLVHTKSLRLDQSDMSSKFDTFHWSTRLFPSYVHQSLYFKMERWKEYVKLGWI